MIEQEMEQMDIAQHHALFEREMTEVILKLRGEFASISGTDMGYEAYGISAEKLKIPVVSIPYAEITKTAISIPETQQMACGQVPSVKVEQQAIAIPPIPKFRKTSPAFRADKIGVFSISLPHIKPAVVAAIPSIAPKKNCMSNISKEQIAPVWQIGLPSVPVTCIKVTVPAAAQKPASSGQWKNAARRIGQIPGTETWNWAVEQIGRIETAVLSVENAPECRKPMITIPSFSSPEKLDLPRISVTVRKIPSFFSQGETRTAAICCPVDILVPKKPEIDTQIQEILTTFQI